MKKIKLKMPAILLVIAMMFMTASFSASENALYRLHINDGQGWVVAEEIMYIDGLRVLFTTTLYDNMLVSTGTIIENQNGRFDAQEELPQGFIENAMSAFDQWYFSDVGPSHLSPLREMSLNNETYTEFDGTISPNSFIGDSGFFRRSGTSWTNPRVHVQHEFHWQRIFETVGITARHQVLLTGGIIRGFYEGGNAEVIRLDQSVTRHGINFGLSFTFPWAASVSTTSGGTQTWNGVEVRNAFFSHSEHWHTNIHGIWNNMFVGNNLVTIHSDVRVVLRQPAGNTVGHGAFVNTTVGIVGTTIH